MKRKKRMGYRRAEVLVKFILMQSVFGKKFKLGFNTSTIKAMRVEISSYQRQYLLVS